MSFYKETLEQTYNHINHFFNHIDLPRQLARSSDNVVLPVISPSDADITPKLGGSSSKRVASTPEFQRVCDTIAAHLNSASIATPYLPSVASLPDLRRELQEFWNEYRSQKSDDGRMNESEHQLLHHLEALVLAKWTALVYALTMRHLLESSVPLSSSIHYWRSVTSGKRYLYMHFIQTSPFRLYDMVETHQREGFSSVLSFQHVQGGLSEYWSQWSATRTPRSLGLFASRVRANLRMDWLKAEVMDKLGKLEAAKKASACALGMLAEHRLWCPNPPQGTGPFRDHKTSWGLFEMPLSKALRRMQWALTHSMGTGSGSSEVLGIEQISQGALVEDEVLTCLLGVLDDLVVTSPNQLKTTIGLYGRPSSLTRYWFPSFCSLLLLPSACSLLLSQVYTLSDIIKENAVTLKHLITEWVIQPCSRIWKTIRRSDEQEALALLGPQSLHSDLASLQRMVADFVRDNHTDASAQIIQDAVDKAKSGDLTPVLTRYEQELKVSAHSVSLHLLLTLGW
jgi:nuclear-control-of-ATPase protein 2